MMRFLWRAWRRPTVCGLMPLAKLRKPTGFAGRTRRDRARSSPAVDRPRPLLLLELEPVERGVAAALAQQLVVAARFDHVAVLDHEDAVGMRDRGQPVRDHQRGAALAQFGDRLLHLTLGFRIERGGRLVEQDDRRVLDQRARDGDALALAAGELHAVLADRRLVAIRESS